MPVARAPHPSGELIEVLPTELVLRPKRLAERVCLPKGGIAGGTVLAELRSSGTAVSGRPRAGWAAQPHQSRTSGASGHGRHARARLQSWPESAPVGGGLVLRHHARRDRPAVTDRDAMAFPPQARISPLRCRPAGVRDGPARLSAPRLAGGVDELRDLLVRQVERLPRARLGARPIPAPGRPRSRRQAGRGQLAGVSYARRRSPGFR